MPLSLPILEYAAVRGGLGAAPLSHLWEEACCIFLEEVIALALKYFCYKAAIARGRFGLISLYLVPKDEKKV